MDLVNRPWKRLPLVAIPVVIIAVGLIGLIPSGTEVISQETGTEKLRLRAAGDSEAVFVAYPCPPGNAEAYAARLEQIYSNHPGVRVVADQRASQVLVIAPAEIQAGIQQQVAAGTPPPRPTPAAMPTPQPVLSAAGWTTMPGKQDVRLWNRSGQQLEAALVRTFGQRLAPIAGPTPAMSAYALKLAGGESLAMAVDRQGNWVRVEGSPAAVASAAQLIHVVDHPGRSAEDEVELCSLNRARRGDISTVLAAFQANQEPPAAMPPQGPAAVGNESQPVLQPEPPQPPALEQPSQEPTTTQVVPLRGGIAGAEPASEQEGLLGPVQIEILEGLDVLVIRGHKRDVERVRKVIEQIEQLSAETKPVIRILPLSHVDSAALATLLQQVYAEVFTARLGALSITALGKPNAILLIGREETVLTAVDLAKRLDQPVAPSTQFRVFRLKSIPAETAAENVDAFFAQQQQQQQQSAGQTGSLAPRVQVVADFRSNSLIVRGSPRELTEVAAMLERIDQAENDALNQVQVFKLKNALAETLGPVLQDAITGQIYGQRTSRGQFGVAQAAGQQRQDFERKSSRLQFITVDPRGQQVLNSGILTDAQVTADSRTNALVVTASSESMPLIAALIQQLDQPADIESQVKVFTLINSDATAMSQMLEQIFSQTGAAEGLAVRTGTPIDDSSLVGLRFAVDARTNSILVTGSTGALTVVEAILLRLDESDVRNRKTSVYRLKNAPAADVATAVNEYLQSERQVEQIAPELMTAFQQLEREVVVVAEPVSNSLIISATPRFYEEILNLVKEIDQRPPMVMIQVLIAEVRLGDTNEFGIELGLQDSILFDRSSIIGDTPGVLAPGFLFNSGVIGNSASAASLATREDVGGQAITNLGVGRTNTDLGFGGLVLSASSESVSVLIRALEQQQRLEILSRPQVMTMDNQTAQILVGQQVPTIEATQLTQFGVVNSVIYRDVGLIVTVTPRISPEQLVVMEIQAEKSEVGPIAEGIPIAITDSGETIRSPRIDSIITRTVVSALDGQTVVLGGMISKSTQQTNRKVPYLGDIPVLGHLFQYKFSDEDRKELLIIMTPRIIDDAKDAEKVKRIEAARMHWCLCDVMALHDGDGLDARGPAWFDGDAAVIYPDLDPTLKTMQELLPPGDGTNTVVSPETIPTPVPVAPAQNAVPSVRSGATAPLETTVIIGGEVQPPSGQAVDRSNRPVQRSMPAPADESPFRPDQNR
ncbi:MAG: hypothetical protein GXY83_00675 [Rhodopirellula sp.]|nr:hypothetical protein [Rhodopirellula sp.]